MNCKEGVRITIMRHRIFLAINLPEYIKKELSNYAAKLPDLPCRWTKKDNLHITIAFLGYLTEAEIINACDKLKVVALRQRSFQVNLNKIVYAPDQKSPRMIWVQGDGGEEFVNFQKNCFNSLEEYLEKGGQARKSSLLHVTLCRLKPWEFRRIEPEEIPEVNEEIGINFLAESIDIMESSLKRGGPEYAVLESFPFGD